MKQIPRLSILVLSMVLGGIFMGCAAPPEKLDGHKVISVLRETVNSVSEQVSPGVVYVELTMPSRRGWTTRKMTGLILTADGRILIPFFSDEKEATVKKISVWIDGQEYRTGAIQMDKKLRQSIVKIELEEGKTLTPMTLGDANTLMPGDWVIGIKTSDKNYNYRKFTEMAIFAGKAELKDFDELLLNRFTGKYTGSIPTNGVPVVDLNGVVVGLVQGSNIMAINEVKKRTDKLIAQATKEKPPETKEKKEPWLGFIHDALQDDYAEAKGLAKKGVLVTYVFSDTPVAKAGLQPYDVITGVDGQSINQGEWLGWGQFRKLIDPEVDKKIVFNVLRNNKPLLIEAAFGAKPKPQEFTAEDLGVTVQEITEIEYCSYRLRARQGVLVTKVERGSPATTSSSFREGLVYNNNVIIELYNRPTRTVDEFIEAVNILRRDKPAVVLIKLWQGNLITCHALNLKIGSKEKGKE